MTNEINDSHGKSSIKKVTEGVFILSEEERLTARKIMLSHLNNRKKAVDRNGKEYIIQGRWVDRNNIEWITLNSTADGEPLFVKASDYDQIYRTIE